MKTTDEIAHLMRAALEIRLLESLLTHDVKCQMNHRESECSTEATHIVTGCMPGVMACTNAAETKQTKITMSRLGLKRYVCSKCKMPMHLCHRVEPFG